MSDEKKDRKFVYAMPRKWKNKESGKILKVVPWFMPLDDESRFDFKGLIKECVPELGNDVLSDFECYSGLLMQAGWMMENSNGCWLGLVGINMKDHFEDMGEWPREAKNDVG